MIEAVTSFGLDWTRLSARLTQMASDVNFALKHIVMEYIRSVATLSSYPATRGPKPHARPRATGGRRR
jgi:hypothetical protein